MELNVLSKIVLFKGMKQPDLKKNDKDLKGYDMNKHKLNLKDFGSQPTYS